MDKAAVITRIEEGRRAFEDTLLKQSEDALTREGTLHDWALKDIVAHLTFWQRLVSARLAAMLGETHDFAQYFDTGRSVPQLNDEYYSQVAHLPAADILLDSKQAHDELIALVHRLPEDWLPRTDLAWTDGDALWDHITNDGSAHFIEHIEDINHLEQES
jgi:hypothetical protein